MTATLEIPGLVPAPTRNVELVRWVGEIAALTTPDRVGWCDGSEQAWQRRARGAGGGRDGSPDRARPGGVVRRLGAGVAAARRRAGRQRDLPEAGPGEAAEQL